MERSSPLSRQVLAVRVFVLGEIIGMTWMGATASARAIMDGEGIAGLRHLGWPVIVAAAFIFFGWIFSSPKFPRFGVAMVVAATSVANMVIAWMEASFYYTLNTEFLKGAYEFSRWTSYVDLAIFACAFVANMVAVVRMYRQ